MDCKTLIKEYLLCIRKIPQIFPCEDKCKIEITKALRCLETVK